jgi:hypothetical protein
MRLIYGRSLWFQKLPQWFAHGGQWWGESLHFGWWYLGYEFKYDPFGVVRRWPRRFFGKTK